MIGRTVSHYEVVAPLGQGGMGVVYKAHDQSLDRMVALKFLTSNLSEHRQARIRFVNEAKAASSLEHPNICTIHEIGETDDGQTYIVMPFYDGESFKERAQRGVDPTEAMELVRQAALGLAKAHQSKLIHRDVKSQNLFVTRDGHVKVLDFGLAKLAGQTQITRTGAIMGTLQYMSPEQARGEDLDARTDVYSLGVVFYELLTGRLPFPAKNQAAALNSILNTQPEAPSITAPIVPAALDAIVMRAISKIREDRYSSLNEMIADLDAALSGEHPVSAPGLSKRRSGMWTRIAIVIALAVLGTGGWYLLSREASPVLQEQPVATASSIGVMYIENLSADASLDWMQKGVVELLNTALSRFDDLTVVDSQRMAEIMGNMGEDPSEGITQGMAAEVAREAGVASMLVGNIVKTGATMRLQLRMIDVDTGEILYSDEVDGQSDDNIFAMVAALTERIRSHFEITSIAQSVDEQWMREITTSSVDAYRDYIRGRGYFIQNEHTRAREFFERAIAADPDFIMAYVDLMGTCLNLGDFECIGAAYEQALRLRPNASRKERLYIDLTGAVIDGESERQITLATELLQLNPQARFWRYILGRGYYVSDQYERALLEWEPLISDGYYWVWTYLYASNACLELGRHDEALRIVQRGFEITPPENTSAMAGLHRYRGRVYRESGAMSEALADFRECVGLDPDYRPVIDYDLGRLYEKQGELAKAIASYEAHLTVDSNPELMDDARARLVDLRGALSERESTPEE